MTMQILKSISWVMVSVLAGCKASAPDVGRESGVMGRAGFFAEALPTPDVKASAILRKFGGFLVSQAPRIEAPAAARHGLDNAIYEGLLKFGGMPRWQLRNTLAELVAPTSRQCGSENCARLFQLETSQIDEFLDELYKKSAQSAELKKPEKVLVRRMILGSLKPEDGPKAADAQAKVTFKNVSIEYTVRRLLGMKGVIRVKDLDQIQKFDIYIPHLFESLEDFRQFRNLQELRVSCNHRKALVEVARYTKNLRVLTIRAAWETSRLTYDDIDVLALTPYLSSLTVENVKTAGMERVVHNFSSLKELKIQASKNLNQSEVRAIGKMKNLKKFALQAPYPSLPPATEPLLPRSIQTVEFHGQGSDCGNLANLRIFSNATNMKISGCKISSVGDQKTQFGWQQLALQGCYTLGDARIALSVKASNLPSLQVFQSDNPALDLDAASREYMTVNLARSAKGG